VRTLCHWLLIAAAASAIQVGGLWTTPILDRDEARFAEAARDMRARGDLLVPWFNGEPRYHKPILIYWLLWGSFALLGPSEAAARLPSVGCIVLLAILSYELGRALVSRRAGLLSALFLLASPLVWFEGRLGTADAALTCAMTAVFLCRFRASSSPRSWGWAAGEGAALGLAVLAKGPVALAILLTFLLASAVLERAGPREEVSRRRPAAAAAASLLTFGAVALPWALAAGFRTGWAFWIEGIGHHFLGRLGTSYEGHRMFPGAHTLLLGLTCLPWSVFIPGAAVRSWRAVRSGDPRARFLLAWALGPLLLFEAASSRLIHYTLPIIPALALSVAWFLDGTAGPGPFSSHALLDGGRWAHRLPAVAMLLLAGVAFALWELWAKGIAPAFGDLSAVLPGFRAMLAVLILAAVLSLVLGKRREGRPALAAALIGWCLALALLGWLVIPALPPLSFSRRIAAAIGSRNERQAGDRVLLVSYREPSLVFYLRRDLFPAPGQVVEASPQGAAELLREWAGPAWIVASGPDLAAAADGAGPRVRTVAQVEGFNVSRGRELRLLIARAD
jgi:4-amino-4-deoxy-L-arabinose transferase-like glycosyltransferase